MNKSVRVFAGVAGALAPALTVRFSRTFISAMFLTGCSLLTDPLKSGYTGYSIEPLTADNVRNYQQNISDLLNTLGFDRAMVNLCSEESAPSNCKAFRNRVIATLVMSSEELCLAHRRGIYGKEATFNIVAGTLTNLFAGWAAVAPSERGKSILSALALFSNSERSLVNELVYKSVVVAAVDKKILQIRDIEAHQLKLHFNDSVDSYPLALALSDTLDFHRSCSFVTGLEKAVEEGTQETPHQKAERLKRDLLVLEQQIDSSSNKVATDPVYAGRIERLKSLNEEVRSLEKQ